jgi:hypothetical protein
MGRPIRPSPASPISGVAAPYPDRLPTTAAVPCYLLGGVYPEVLDKVGLPPGPGDEHVQAPWVEARVGVRQSPQGAPARGPSFHAEPQHLQFFEVAEG